eukprot:sb/3472208/
MAPAAPAWCVESFSILDPSVYAFIKLPCVLSRFGGGQGQGSDQCSSLCSEFSFVLHNSQLGFVEGSLWDRALLRLFCPDMASTPDGSPTNTPLETCGEETPVAATDGGGEGDPAVPRKRIGSLIEFSPVRLGFLRMWRSRTSRGSVFLRRRRKTTASVPAVVAATGGLMK